MKEFKKKSPFNIQVLEGIDPMSDASLSEIKGGLGCKCKAGTLEVKPCLCNKGTLTMPPIKPVGIASEPEVQSYLTFE